MSTWNIRTQFDQNLQPNSRSTAFFGKLSISLPGVVVRALWRWARHRCAVRADRGCDEEPRKEETEPCKTQSQKVGCGWVLHVKQANQCTMKRTSRAGWFDDIEPRVPSLGSWPSPTSSTYPSLLVHGHTSSMLSMLKLHKQTNMTHNKAKQMASEKTSKVLSFMSASLLWTWLQHPPCREKKLLWSVVGRARLRVESSYRSRLLELWHLQFESQSKHAPTLIDILRVLA